MDYFRLTIFSLLLLISLGSKAQQYEFGINGGATGYMGDLNATNPLYVKNVGAGLFAKYNLNSTWGIRLAYNYIKLTGDDMDFSNSYQQNRKLQFNNTISEISLMGDFNFYRYIASRDINKYTPYVVAGVAALMHDPYIVMQNEKIKLRELKLEYDATENPGAYSKITYAIPVGVGFKYNIKGPWSLGAEVIYRAVLSDNIDNVSQYYPTEMPTDIKLPVETWEYLADPSQSLATHAGKARGDGKKFDGYMTAGITLTYTIVSKKCYWWQ